MIIVDILSYFPPTALFNKMGKEEITSDKEMIQLQR